MTKDVKKLNDISDREKIILALKNSLLYAMSLGSHELYHSNVWAWLFNYNRDFIKAFFDDIETNADVQITREEGNRDITIWVKGKAYVIENKFKSLPDKAQLDKYEGKLGEKFAGGVVTGIDEPVWINGGKWKFISYSDIADEMSKIAKDIEGPEGNSIREYVDIVRNLMKLISEFRTNVGERWVTTQSDYLREVRLADLCHKLHANKFAEYILNNQSYKACSERAGNCGWELAVKSEFRRNTGIVDVMCFRGEKAIGIQLQGNSYRKMLMMRMPAEEVYNKAVDVQWLSSEWGNERSKKSRQKNPLFKQFNQHDGMFFVYHDWKIAENDSFDSLSKRVYADLEKVLNILPGFNA